MPTCPVRRGLGDSARVRSRGLQTAAARVLEAARGPVSVDAAAAAAGRHISTCGPWRATQQRQSEQRLRAQMAPLCIKKLQQRKRPSYHTQTCAAAATLCAITYLPSSVFGYLQTSQAQMHKVQTSKSSMVDHFEGNWGGGKGLKMPFQCPRNSGTVTSSFAAHDASTLYAFRIEAFGAASVQQTQQLGS